MSNQQHQPYRSFFWPVITLGAGVIWLLTNLGMISTENLWILIQLWPILLIIIGLDVLFARRLPLVGALLALLTVGAVVFVLLEGGSLALSEKPEPRTETFVVSAEDVEAARFNLDLTAQPADVSGRQNSELLIDAEIGHFGNVEMIVAGGADKEVTLEQRGMVSWLVWLLPEAHQELVWDIGLSTEVPFELNVNGSTGVANFDLSEVQLEAFYLDGSTGASTIVFPASQEGYQARVDASTGEIRIVLPAEGNLTLRLDGSTGQITLDVPEGAAFRLEVQNGGTGDVIRPDWMMKVEGQPDRDEGVYQTQGFDAAEYQLTVIMEDLSTGNLVIE